MQAKLRLFVLAGLVCGVLFGAPSCTLIVNPQATQCDIDSDCAKGDAFEGFVCEPTQKVCVLSTTYCNSNAQCIDANGAENFICDKTAHVCKNLFSTECTRLLADNGDLRNDDAIIFGLPWHSSLITIFPPGENSIELARRDLKAAVGGIPSVQPGGAPRPLVWLVCDVPDSKVPIREAFAKQMDVLLDRIGLPFMLGSLFPDIMQDQVNRGVPKETMIFGQVPMLSTYRSVPGSDGLVFTYWPSLEASTDAFTSVVKVAESKLLAAGATAPLKVTVAVQASPVTASAVALFKQRVRFNNKNGDENGDNLQVLSLGKLGETTTSQQIARGLADVEAFDPDIIVCPTISDCNGLNLAYEPKRPGRAFWIGNEQMSDPGAYVKTPEQQKKFLLVFPGRIRDTPELAEIRAYYQLTFPDDFAQSPFVTYYNVGWVASILAAGVKDGQITGRKLGEILKSSFAADGEKIKPGIDGYRAAFDAVRAGRKINTFDEMEFAPDGAAILPRMDVACANGDGSFVITESGAYYSLRDKELKGTVTCF